MKQLKKIAGIGKMKTLTHEEIAQLIKDHHEWLQDRNHGEHKTYKDLRFSDYTFDSVDFSFAVFYNSKFTDSVFDSSVFYKSKFYVSEFNDSEFNDSEFDSSVFYNSVFYNSEFYKSKFNDSVFYNSEFYDSEFNYCAGVRSHDEQQKEAQRILSIIDTDKGELAMQDWHTCKTSHCIAGWLYPQVEFPAQVASQNYPFLSQYFYEGNEQGLEAIKAVASGNFNYIF
jgi:hypothetical protein